MSGPDRTKLPIRRPEFRGTLARTLGGSEPDWTQIDHVHPPAGAPNVLVVLIDDAGFGNPSTFGGPIETPNYSRMAERGLRYNRFHVTALCSPTRAALLTGRNSHTVGFGSIGEFSNGFPGYTALLPRDCAPLAADPAGERVQHRRVRQVAPDAGWAAGRGRAVRSLAERVGLRLLLRDPGRWQQPVGSLPRREPEDYRHRPRRSTTRDNPYYFPDAMADRTIQWLHGVRAQDATKPFFVYFSTGCSHAPHHVSNTWADKYKGRFDQGWDRLREQVFARQRQLGVVPPDAELTPRNEAFPAWDDVSDRLKAYYARQMEVYAGYSENADHNAGRVIEAIEELGELDNTLVIWIWGDNGASMEGSLTGSFNELTMQNGIPLTDEMQMQLAERYGGLEAWGGPMLDPHYSAAWAWAGNTPFQWGKQMGSHLGGTRDPMVVHWPARVTEAGGLRSQFTHVIDVAPTILDVCGIPAPDEVDGIAQEPLHGIDVRRLVHRRGRARAAHPAVLRERRQPGHVQGRLVAGDAHRAHPLGADPRRARAVRAGRVEPRRRPGRALLPAGRLQPGPRPCVGAPRQGRGAAGAVLVRGREIPGAATPGPAQGVLRDRSSAAGGRDVRVPRRRRERPVGDDPARSTTTRTRSAPTWSSPRAVRRV